MVWIVSNCKTQSKREEYMAELSKYIKVDVFGKCGNFTPECDSLWHSSCTNNMMQDYKFYFAAENSICKDYFTGKIIKDLYKVFRILSTLRVRPAKNDATSSAQYGNIFMKGGTSWGSCSYRLQTKLPETNVFTGMFSLSTGGWMGWVCRVQDAL